MLAELVIAAINAVNAAGDHDWPVNCDHLRKVLLDFDSSRYLDLDDPATVGVIAAAVRIVTPPSSGSRGADEYAADLVAALRDRP